MPVFAILCCAIAPDKEPDRGLGVCPACGSPHLTAVEYYGPTGVISPDGGQEYQMQRGYKCLLCGEVEKA
jgi:hypothetical protein